MNDLYNKYDPKFWDNIIEQFYKKNCDDPLIGHLFKDVELSRIISMNKTLIMCALSISNASLAIDVANSHKHLGITAQHFERFLYNFFCVLRSNNVEDEDLEFLLAVINLFKSDLTNS